MIEDYTDHVDRTRRALKGIGVDVVRLQVRPSHVTDSEWAEVMAQTTLAFRHLEDASTRLGKVLQVVNGLANDGGSMPTRNQAG